MENEKSSDSEFMARLFKDNYEMLIRYVFRMTKSITIAEDIVQDTFYEALRKQTILELHPRPNVWLAEMTKNKLKAWKKTQEKREKELFFRF